MPLVSNSLTKTRTHYCDHCEGWVRAVAGKCRNCGGSDIHTKDELIYEQFVKFVIKYALEHDRTIWATPFRQYIIENMGPGTDVDKLWRMLFESDGGPSIQRIPCYYPHALGFGLGRDHNDGGGGYRACGYKLR